MAIAEIGDFSKFDSPDKILAYVGMSLSNYQSGQLANYHSRMEKPDSRYLRYVLCNATIYVCLWNPTFKACFAKKQSEVKHYYNCNITHYEETDSSYLPTWKDRLAIHKITPNQHNTTSTC